jgi:hypothetical protein
LKKGVSYPQNEKEPVIHGIYSDYSFVKNPDGVSENESIHVFQPAVNASKDLMINFKMK